MFHRRLLSPEAGPSLAQTGTRGRWRHNECQTIGWSAAVQGVDRQWPIYRATSEFALPEGARALSPTYRRTVTFEVSAEAYGRFMGRFSEPLAQGFADSAGVTSGQRALDVGCGPGALTDVLVRRLGPEQVSAVDPSHSFVAAARARFPDVDVQVAVAEGLPYADDTFDVTLAQLVVHFMIDPVAGLAEMARVTRPDGTVAACVWDLAGGTGPLSTFWAAVHDLDPDARDESGLPGARKGHLAELCAAAGLVDVEASVLTVHVPFATFDQWWQPYTGGVGPAGAYVARLDPEQRERLRDRCATRRPPAPFVVDASAWCVRARPA